jgi:hypothetical protein
LDIFSNCGHDTTGTPIPTRPQLYNRKSYINASRLPSKDILQNLQSEFSDFIKRMTVFPEMQCVFCYDDQMELLVKEGQQLLIDTTHDVVNGDSHLTTVIACIEGIGIPLVWFVHRTKTSDAYADLLEIMVWLSLC